jgi:hypothetical protein
MLAFLILSLAHYLKFNSKGNKAFIKVSIVLILAAAFRLGFNSENQAYGLIYCA